MEENQQQIPQKKPASSAQIRWLVRTAILLAVLITCQLVTQSMGQYVTGSAVNLILTVSALVGGFWCGATIAVISPFFALLFGIAPPVPLITPAVAAGNLVLVILVTLLANPKKKTPLLMAFGAVVVAAALKAATLWALVAQLIVPTAGLPEAKAAAISAMFSLPQFITATIGGCIAMLIIPVLRKAIKK